MQRRRAMQMLYGVAPVVASGALPFFASGTAAGAGHQGYSAGVSGLLEAFGTPTPTILSAPGGRVIKAVYFDVLDIQTYIALDGTEHVAFLTGLTVWINGIARTCASPGTASGISYAILAGSNIVPNPGNYTVSFVAP